MLRDLIGLERLAVGLCETAPLNCATQADAQSIIARYAVQTGAGFWSLYLIDRGEHAEMLWEDMSREYQRRLEGDTSSFRCKST
ncbi:MAG: hypothetical protein RO009_06915 [Pseudorhodoplanes sp.]|jgi:hypothetical protein|nr:hypothetical protein [Pseudorhodoplanes sp.]